MTIRITRYPRAPSLRKIDAPQRRDGRDVENLVVERVTHPGRVVVGAAGEHDRASLALISLTLISLGQRRKSGAEFARPCIARHAAPPEKDSKLVRTRMIR